MQQEDKILLSHLKKEIAAVMKQSYPAMNSEIDHWKGEEITDFQQDLLTRVNGRLSEKWFYTHMKASNPSLPRIDVLNMLSKYAGYVNWDDFRYRNSSHSVAAGKSNNANSIFIKIPVLVIIIVAILYALYRFLSIQSYQFTFIDADTGEPIINSNISTDVILNNESPLTYTCNKDGSLTIRTDASKIKLAVRSPYYLPDTFERILKKFNRFEQIKLHPDAYALMIHYFSQTDVMSWQKRREQLNRMISDRALIYQLPGVDSAGGMELYNKWEFIDKLTMPASNLRKIEILDTRYDTGQIVILRFKIKVDK